MEKSSYGQRDYAFGQAMLTLRTSIGLTQAQLAEDLGVSRNAVGDWEAGSSYPSTSHLKDFIVLCVRASAFAAGHEAEEIRALWQAARQKVRLDDLWFSTLLAQQSPSGRPPVVQPSGPAPLLAPAAGEARVDWGGALAVPPFYGREGELTTLRDPDRVDAYFWGLAWSPDGKLLACAAPFSGVLLWDVRAGCGRWLGRDLALLIRRLAWSPDGTRLAGGAEDGHVYVWEASDGRLLQRMPGHHGAVMSVAWSPDGSRLASAGGDSRNSGELFVWDAYSGERMYTLQGLVGVVYTVAWHPLGDLLISGGSDGQLRWWEIPRLRCVRVREAHQGTVQALKVSPDGSLLATCGDDGAITLWNLESGDPLRTLRRDRPYERLNITGIRGLTEAQKATLRALGAREESAPSL